MTLKELYNKLKENGKMLTVKMDVGLGGDCVLGYPVYRGETEGGLYDEVLYVTDDGRVVYGLVPCQPSHMHECPDYAEHDAQYLIDRCNSDGMNQLPKINV
jgi:hypothetical protein